MAYSRSSGVSHFVVAGKSGNINLSHVRNKKHKFKSIDSTNIAIRANPIVIQPST